MLHWKNETRLIGDLKPYQFNPRKITENELDKLRDSIERNGYNSPILIDTDNTIVAGHQRWFVLKELGYDEIDVRVPERKLTEDEFKENNVKDNVNNGDWDHELLKEYYPVDQLIEWGVEDFQLDVPGEIEDISQVVDINESVNFTIKCESLSQLEELKAKLKVTATKVTYEDFIRCLK